jgi:hypothetical protein
MHAPVEEHLVAAKYLPKDRNPDLPDPSKTIMEYVRMKNGMNSWWSG